MKKTNKNNLGCVESQSSCTKWTGLPIPCLDICTGDDLDDVIFSIAEKVCENFLNVNLESLDLACIIEKFKSQLNPPVDIIKLLQVLLNNDCTLFDMIKAVEAKIIDPNRFLDLDLKCLLDQGSTSLSTIKQEDLNKLFISTVCSIKGEINIIKSSLSLLQSQVNGIQIVPYQEPVITSCLYTSRPASQAVNIIANDYCKYKLAIGSSQKITSAVSKQCSTVAKLFTADQNFVQSPLDMSDSHGNQWIALCNALERIAAIENTCCAPSCDKVKIGFIYSYDYDTKELTLTFTSGAGSVIPLGFIDCGSQFIFKDCSGAIILTSVLPIVAGGSLVFNLPQGACLSKLTLSLKTKFCLKDNNGVTLLTCQDCLSKELSIQPECCTLCNEGEDPVGITYEYQPVPSA